MQGDRNLSTTVMAMRVDFHAVWHISPNKPEIEANIPSIVEWCDFSLPIQRSTRRKLLMGAELTVDIIAGGLNAAHLPLWSQMAQRTSGMLILQEGFGGMLTRNIAAALQRKHGTDVQLDFVCSHGVSVESVIGPALVDATARQPHLTNGTKQAARSKAARNAPTLEAGQAFAVLLQSKQDIASRHVVVQAIARWCTPTRLFVTRVCRTVSLALASRSISMM
jgi:hypothetical protein